MGEVAGDDARDNEKNHGGVDGRWPVSGTQCLVPSPVGCGKGWKGGWGKGIRART
jgi:hypothetical protein